MYTFLIIFLIIFFEINLLKLCKSIEMMTIMKLNALQKKLLNEMNNSL